MKVLVLVGGASASGKSVFVELLQQKIEGAYSYRRLQAFRDCAKSRNIEDARTFDLISQKMADDWFVNVCNCHDFIISDVHYVIQLKRDSNTISEKIVKSNAKKYIPTISKRLIEKLKESNIQIVCVLVSASSSVIFERSKLRNEQKNRELKYNSLDEVIIEQRFEEEHWKTLISDEKILSINIDSEINSSEKMVNIFIDFLQSISEYKQSECNKSLIKRRKL